MSTRVLGAGDEAALESFLVEHADTAMFLRSNARRVGLVYREAPYHGTYVARFDAGSMVAVAAHYWNGMVMVEAPVGLEELVRELLRASGRRVTGFSGAWGPCVRARSALGMDATPPVKCDREELFALSLDALIVPPALERGDVRCRLAREDDLDRLEQWRVEYMVEAIGSTESPTLRREARASVERALSADAQFVLEDGAGLLAMSAFNAQLPDSVQIGGVWTPPSLRGRGHARAVVAGSLLHARSSGVRRSVLFTGEHHEQARRAYLALGYRVIGDYALMLFA